MTASVGLVPAVKPVILFKLPISIGLNGLIEIVSIFMVFIELLVKVVKFKESLTETLVFVLVD